MLVNKDYMLGDFVLYEGTIVVINALNNNEVIVGTIPNCSISYHLKYEEVFPIPLTEEILYANTYDNEANAYRVYNTEHYIQYCLGKDYVIKYWREKDMFTYEGLPLKYVSDLQHLVKIMKLSREIEV